MSDSIFVCACQPGRLLFNGKCVLPGDCGCVFTDGRAFKAIIITIIIINIVIFITIIIIIVVVIYLFNIFLLI